MDRHRCNGRCNGLSSSFRRLLPHHLRSNPFQNPLTPIARRPSCTFPIGTRQSKRHHIHNAGTPPDVRQIVLENPDSILSSINPGTVIIDHTSSHPTLAKQIFDAARDKNCWSVDAPVSGGDIGAREGKLAIFAGGDEAITVGGSLLGLSEGLVFAEASGLDKSRWLQAVRGGAAGSLVMDLFGERMIGRDFRPGGFAEYMVKDLGMGLDVVEEDGDEVAVLPGAGLCKQLFSGMVANGDGKLGTQGLVTVIERINGKR
ncbi:hypothetical protein L1987_49062 [Smallanthus sonchifolius]|uniref:Uncharacterized protein n=1 Tax=Smallanthus sonchifolius TaxID=185202 RepID=A0ACB9FT13_9ASTR|nr:hypothetical protein L1987_49062 [Smallanthus sonchifolius]